MEKPFFRATVQQVMHDVEAGSTLAEALGRHPRVFSDLFTNMVAAGEAGGILDDDPDAARRSTWRRPTP